MSSNNCDREKYTDNFHVYDVSSLTGCFNGINGCSLITFVVIKSSAFPAISVNHGSSVVVVLQDVVVDVLELTIQEL